MGNKDGIFQKKSKNNCGNNCNYICCLDSRLNASSNFGKIVMNTKFQRRLILLFAVFFIIFTITPSDVFAANITQKQAREKINQLQRLENAEKNKLYRNQKKLETASNNLQTSKTQYSSVETKLSQLERDYARSSAEFEVMDAQLKSRIRQVFKSQRTGMFELLLSAKDFNAFMDMIYFEQLIIKKDYNNLVQVKNKAQRLAQLKNDIESRKKYLAQSIKNINSQQRDLERAIAQNQNMIKKLKTDRSYYEKTERELARQSDNLQSMLSNKTQDNTVQVASAGFIKPIRGSITSPFGWRTHPIFNSRTFHSGIDIGGPNYGNIVASNAGKVIYSGWYGGYGKVVILDHGVVNGNPMTTLYAHMSTIKVNQGQTVQKGQVIGLEGTTGYSTGPHCHFEVRINGKPNNPLNYI